MYRRIVVALAAWCAGAAAAQGAQLDPAQPQATGKPPEYRSAFEGYRPFAEQEVADWRKANEEVREAGGHAGHGAGQGSRAEKSKPQPGSPESSGASRGHEGHAR